MLVGQLIPPAAYAPLFRCARSALSAAAIDSALKIAGEREVAYIKALTRSPRVTRPDIFRRCVAGDRLTTPAANRNTMFRLPTWWIVIWWVTERGWGKFSTPSSSGKLGAS
jgi:hypothetical protein